MIKLQPTLSAWSKYLFRSAINSTSLTNFQLSRAFSVPQSQRVRSQSFNTSKRMASTKTFLDAVKGRRTYYDLKSESTIPDSRIQEICKTAITYCPSSFNSQSTRIVLLVKDQHQKLWDIVEEVLLSSIDHSKHEATSKKLGGFRKAYGSILFLEDPEPVQELQGMFPTYFEKFAQWSEHTSAIHQFTLWTALEAEGLGANLQHYNPLIDERVKAEWGIDPKYKLISQLVFGTPNSPPNDRPKLVTYKPLEDTFRVFGTSD